MNNKKFILDWLKDHKYCVIATSCENQPWAATVDYLCDEEMNIYISTNPNSMNFQNILNNPSVCLVIDSQDHEGTLRIKGRAEAVSEKDNNGSNLLVKPEFLIFKRKEEKTDKLFEIRLNLPD